MQSPASVPGRKPLPHLNSKDLINQSIIQYVSMNVPQRRPLLANKVASDVILAAWAKADDWLVGRYVLMPDHLHLFCAPASYPPTPLKRWVLFWRAEVTRKWPFPEQKPIWQKQFFDRQLRSGESYHEKWNYVWRNPVRAGLVARPEAIPGRAECIRLARTSLREGQTRFGTPSSREALIFLVWASWNSAFRSAAGVYVFLAQQARFLTIRRPFSNGQGDRSD
jgi:putative transposase